MFKAIKDNKIIAVNESGSFPCLVYDSIEEESKLKVDDFVDVGGEYLPITDEKAKDYMKKTADAAELEELRSNMLNSNDAIFAALEKSMTEKEVSDLIKQRQAWRARIKELEGK